MRQRRINWLRDQRWILLLGIGTPIKQRMCSWRTFNCISTNQNEVQLGNKLQHSHIFITVFDGMHEKCPQHSKLLNHTAPYTSAPRPLIVDDKYLNLI